MDFPLSDEEGEATLEEVFALIDSCTDLSSSDDSGSSSIESDTTSVSAVPTNESIDPRRHQGHTTLGPAKSKPKRKRIRRPEMSSTAYQRRKRAELRALREQSMQLEAMLSSLLEPKQLQASPTVPETIVLKTAGKPPSGTWYQVAIIEYHRRLQAEKVNRRLKDMWASNFRMNEHIRQVLQSRCVARACEPPLMTGHEYTI